MHLEKRLLFDNIAMHFTSILFLRFKNLIGMGLENNTAKT